MGGSIPKGPWDEKWTLIRALEPGGQGFTWIVEAKPPQSNKAVLKILRNQASEVARGRMYQEVGNLILLNSLQAKVPRVIDHNKDRFSDLNTPLYFTMELVTGDTLAQVVASRGGLDLPTAIAITLDIAGTVGKAHAHNVQHRDLKPENIVVRDLSKSDSVLLDFGLSFNNEEGITLTSNSEMLDNKFLSLPERRVRGGARRDPRSDLTGICAILYFCLTGHPPVDLRDERNLPPHRRSGFTIRERLKDSPEVPRLEALLDRGFAQELENRFQSHEELADRLQGVMTPVTKTEAEDPIVLASSLSQGIRIRSRRTKLLEFQRASGGFFEPLISYLNSLSNKIGVYQVAAGMDFNQDLPKGFDAIGSHRLTVTIRIAGHKLGQVIQYAIGSKGDQCSILRRMYLEKAPPLGPVGWKELLWYPGMEPSGTGELLDDLKGWLVTAMKDLSAVIHQSDPPG